MNAQRGELWRVRIGALEGTRRVIATHERTVEVCAPTVHMTDVYRWHEIEFLELLERKP